MYITRMRSPLRDTQTENPEALCEDCQGEVYSGEHLYLWEGKRICSDCLSSKINRLLRDSPLLLAHEMNLDAFPV